MMAAFDVASFYDDLQTKHLGRKLIYSEVTGSTMDDARKLAHSVSDHPHGTVIMAGTQTKARGARDHKWDATNLGNIYVSFILHMPAFYKTFEGKFSLEVAACLAVLKSVHKLGVKEAIPKWPNDVWIKGHKLAGFLAEDGKMEVPGTTKSLLILGIGINVNSDIHRNPDLHSIATSLLCERSGTPVNREQFFADVCENLEEALAQPNEVNWKAFTEQNLFQRDCDISVTCASEGKVFDAKFVEICDNWEVKFCDKRTEEVLQGRSDFYTIRPKVCNKIVVAFSGVQGSSSASHLSKWLTSVVDTSRFFVCLVPESSITSNGDWTQNCSLLVLAECPENSDALTSTLRSFLRSGGRVMASGVAASSIASLLDVPVKEGLLESSVINPELALVHLHPDQTQTTSPPNAREAKNLVVFPTSHVCYQFFHKSAVSDKVKIIARYAGEGDSDVAIFTTSSFDKGKVAIWGFDPASVYPGTKEAEVEGHGQTHSELEEVRQDRFCRDSLMQNVLALILD